MKVTRFLLFILTIATLLLSACGGTAATPNPGAGKVEPIPVAFVGTVESIAGDQWVINGQTVTVAPDVIRDGPFNVGDQIKVEVLVNADGSFAVSHVEAATPEDASALPPFGNENSNDSNVNDANVNDANANSNDVNSNDDNSNSVNSNDDNGNDDNSNDDNSNDANINDDNDDNGNDANSNDDNGGNDNSDDSNSNDDNSSSGGNDDNGGGGNNDNGGDDDNGGGGNDNGGNSNG